MNLNEKIRRIREEKNMTMKELSKISGVSVNQISFIERNLTTNIRLNTIDKLAKAFNITPSELIKEEDFIGINNDIKELNELIWAINKNIEQIKEKFEKINKDLKLINME